MRSTSQPTVGAKRRPHRRRGESRTGHPGVRGLRLALALFSVGACSSQEVATGNLDRDAGTTSADAGPKAADGGANAADAGHPGDAGGSSDAHADAMHADASADASLDVGADSFISPADAAGDRVVVDAAPGDARGGPGGMTVAHGQVYDATGAPWIPWGVNKVHVDELNPGLEATNTNAVRVNLYFTLPNAVTTDLMNRFVGNHVVIIPGRWDATCVADSTFPSALSSEVDAWVAESADWKPYESVSIINITNEAGPASSTVWRDQYISAVQRMRANGYGGLLAVDSGGCGQDPQDLIQYAAAVLAADPMHNILFDLHIYGGFQAKSDVDTALDQIQATGISVMLGEFGPGRDIGPSPTNLAPEDVMASAMAHGVGALAWAADDIDLADSMADDAWFSMFYDLNKTYTGDPADLTIFGKVIVNDPTVGLVAVAKKAGGF